MNCKFRIASGSERRGVEPTEALGFSSEGRFGMAPLRGTASAGFIWHNMDCAESAACKSPIFQKPVGGRYEQYR